MAAKCLHEGLRSHTFSDGSEIEMCPGCSHGTLARQKILTGGKRAKTSKEICEEAGYTTVETPRPKPRADSLLAENRDDELAVEETEDELRGDLAESENLMIAANA